MNRDELEILFRKYLNRNFTDKEWKAHGYKSIKKFEIELSNCEEYLKLKHNNINTKIAIIISGHIRKNSILQGIQKFCKNENYHIFIHTWDNIGIKGKETSFDDRIHTDFIIKEINKYDNLKKYEIENNEKWTKSEKLGSNYFNLSSPEIFIKSQLYSVNRSYKLMEEYSIKNKIKYDIVFKFRFDCDVTNFNITDKLISDINDYDIIFTPNSDCKHEHIDYGTSCWACDNMYYKYDRKIVHIFEHTNIICDIFAYGSMGSMKKYCDLYNNYDNLNNSFLEENLKYYKKVNTPMKYDGDNYILDKGRDGHIDSLYYYYCSYPERLLQKFLRDYMLVESKEVKIKLVR